MSLGLIALALLSLVALELGANGICPATHSNSAMDYSLGTISFRSSAPGDLQQRVVRRQFENRTALCPPDHRSGDSSSYIDTYTGIGEVAAVYRLTRMFDADHAQFVLKRSLLVTWDEASIKNLIFIGSSAENPSLRVLPDTSDFTIVADDSFAGFVNHHPKPGEPAMYSRPEHPLTRDYAVLALLPGMQPGKRYFDLQRPYHLRHPGCSRLCHQSGKCRSTISGCGICQRDDPSV